MRLSPVWLSKSIHSSTSSAATSKTRKKAWATTAALSRICGVRWPFRTTRCKFGELVVAFPASFLENENRFQQIPGVRSRMLQAFIVVFREGFESFLIVGIILAYLRRIGQHRLVPAMYWGIAASLVASAGLGYMLSKGVNEALWEGLFGVATIILVGTLVVHMWKAGAQMKREMESKLSRISARSSGLAFVGVFLFTLVII